MPISRDPHSFARPDEARVRHVSLDIALDFEARRIQGRCALRLERTDPGAPLVLDTDGLAIQAVTGADGSPRSFALGTRDPKLGAPLEIELAPEDDEVVVSWTTAEDAKALQWLGPEQTAGREHPFLFTQGQSILTRSWIPLQDGPGVRVTFDARVRGPEPLVVLMAAERLGPDESGAWRFEMAEPIPPYLFALACGSLAFEPISERCGVWAEPSVVEAARWELEETEAMVRSAEDLFGPYPWGRFDVLVLPPAFPFGGMENPRLTFATPTILAGDRSLVALVAHELAHSWSGNLVTNATWGDFWLNEGFTVWAEQRIVERVFGVERSTMEKELARADLEEALAELEPWAQVLAMNLDGRHPDEGFSLVPYEKGALLLRRLEEVVGRDAFDAFLGKWLSDHAFGSVRTVDFETFLARELAVSQPAVLREVDLQRWLRAPGLPEDAPTYASEAFAAVDRAREEWLGGAVTAALGTERWSTQEWLRFLERMPASVGADAMARLDEAFGFTRSGNAEILCAWLGLAIERGYAGADERLEEFLLEVGRAKFLRPLYKKLAATPAGRERALAIYERARAGYHAFARGRVEAVLLPGADGGDGG